MLPTLEATIGILRKDKKTLFIDYRNFPHPIHKGFFAQPGGKIKDGETKESGVIREIYEETGIKVNSVIYRGVVLFRNERRTFQGRPTKYNFRVYYFESSDFDDSKAKAHEGVLAWISDNDTKALRIQEGDLIILNWLQNYKEIEAEIISNGNKVEEAILKSFKS